MTYYSWKQQYTETDEEYNCFKTYLALGLDRSLQNVQKALCSDEKEGTPEAIVGTSVGIINTSATPVSIESLTHMADQWKWVPRAMDHDVYNSLLQSHKLIQSRIQKIDEKLKWLNKNTIEIKDASIKIEKKLLLIEKIVEIEAKIAAERQKSVKIIEKSLKKWQNYDKNRYNFEAEKMKELEKIIHDYDNGYLSSTEFNVETKDYADELIENIRKQKYDNKTNRTH